MSPYPGAQSSTDNTAQARPSSPPDAKGNKPTPPRSDLEVSPTSAVSKIQAPAPLHQRSKGGRANSRAKLAATDARRHASLPQSLDRPPCLRRDDWSSSVAPINRHRRRNGPFRSLICVVVIVIVVAAKTPSGAAVSGGVSGWRSRVASMTRSGC